MGAFGVQLALIVSAGGAVADRLGLGLVGGG